MIRIRHLLAPLALLAALLAAPLADVRAQSSPGLVYGQVPTAAQWNSYFALKQDALTIPPNALLGNSTSSSQSLRYITMPSTCTGANDALIWVPNVGWTCHTIAGGGTINPGAANALPYYALSGNTLSAITSINNGTLITNGSGVPSFSLTLPATVQGNISTVGTIASGAWNATPITVPYGGTGISVFTSGGVPYASSTTTIASSGLLAANGVVIGGGAGAAPSTIATANSGVLVTSGGGVPSISSTLPSAVQDNVTRTGTLVSGATGSGFTVAVGTSTITGVLPSANGGAGSITGALKANGAGVVTQAACSDLSNGATGCSTATGTSGATIPLLNGTNTWSGVQSYTVNDFVLKGSSSGNLTLNAPAAAGTNTITLPAGTTDFSGTGGTSQVVKQTSSGGAFTVARLACSDLSDSGTGCTTTVGTAASAATGTSGHTLGFLDGANTYSALQTYGTGITLSASTLTLADAATWGTTGVAANGSYSTTSTPFFDLEPSWTFSSTSAGLGSVKILPTIIPPASAGNNSGGLSLGVSYGTSANNVANARGSLFTFATAAGYSGTITTGVNVSVTGNGIAGTNPVGTLKALFVNTVTNGNGITSGTVTNKAVEISGVTAAAGSGGTVNNRSLEVQVPSSSSTGNTDYGIYLTGNGGASSTKYALYSDSTAATLLSGILQLPNGAVGAPSLNLGDATSGLYRVASGQIGITSGGVLQGTWLSTGLTMNANTLTFGDGATWSANGISDTVSYSTSTNTGPVTLTYTDTFTSTANGKVGMNLSPTLAPAGASAGNTTAINMQATVGTSSVNLPLFRAAQLQLLEAAGYSGTIAEGRALSIAAPSVSGTNSLTTYKHIDMGAITNGNGITTGTKTNYGISIDSATAAAASGGTITNYAISTSVPSGSGAGTTSNYGVRITGNGGSGGAGTTTNYALYSDSTAASVLAGGLTVGSTTAESTGAIFTASGCLPTAIARSIGIDPNCSGTNIRAFGIDASTNGAFSLISQRSDGSNSLTLLTSSTAGVVSFPQTTNLGTASTDYVTVAGSSTSPVIGTNGGTLTLSPNNAWTRVSGTNPSLNLYDSGNGTDQKEWQIGELSNVFTIRATNDALAASTKAYEIARGTTHNIASHTWYTSTVAGTPVQGMQLTTTALTSAVPLTVTGRTTTTAGFASTGAKSGNISGGSIIDYDGASNSRFYLYGTDASTNGSMYFLSVRSDGTNSRTLLFSDASGNMTSAQPWTLSNTTIKLTGLTTGTNADDVCLQSDGQVVIQTSTCTISSRRFKIDLGAAPFDPAASLRRLDVAYFRYKGDAVSTRDVANSSAAQLGLYAEDVAAAIPGSAIYEPDGVTVKSFRPNAVMGALVGGWNAHDAVLQAMATGQVQLRAANDDLRAANDDLRRRVESLEARR